MASHFVSHAYHEIVDSTMHVPATQRNFENVPSHALGGDTDEPSDAIYEPLRGKLKQVHFRKRSSRGIEEASSSASVCRQFPDN